MAPKHTTHHFAKDTATRTEIADYMSPPVISLGSNATIQETAQLMSEKTSARSL